jgi:hypothetical protein
MFSPGRGCGQAGGKSPLARRRVVTQSKIGNPKFKLKVLVVDDSATKCKIICNYLKRNGLKQPTNPDDDILPQAVFWVKK